MTYHIDPERFRAQSCQPVAFAMSADPFPEETAFHELPYRAVVVSHTKRPVFTADFLEVERGMKRVCPP